VIIHSLRGRRSMSGLWFRVGLAFVFLLFPARVLAQGLLDPPLGTMKPVDSGQDSLRAQAFAEIVDMAGALHILWADVDSLVPRDPLWYERNHLPADASARRDSMTRLTVTASRRSWLSTVSRQGVIRVLRSKQRCWRPHVDNRSCPTSHSSRRAQRTFCGDVPSTRTPSDGYFLCTWKSFHGTSQMLSQSTDKSCQWC